LYAEAYHIVAKKAFAALNRVWGQSLNSEQETLNYIYSGLGSDFYSAFGDFRHALKLYVSILSGTIFPKSGVQSISHPFSGQASQTNTEAVFANSPLQVATSSSGWGGRRAGGNHFWFLPIIHVLPKRDDNEKVPFLR
jgi:hypothetical protein